VCEWGGWGVGGGRERERERERERDRKDRHILFLNLVARTHTQPG
jgi:hypothetical protein